ncbi:hypothetical protein B0H11DRAFT_2237382 [Mycena galericulata]|nr:hypothetical protein B0H11DRAFT_2237382 [Mycena galericulata]
MHATLARNTPLPTNNPRLSCPPRFPTSAPSCTPVVRGTCHSCCACAVSASSRFTGLAQLRLQAPEPHRIPPAVYTLAQPAARPLLTHVFGSGLALAVLCSGAIVVNRTSIRARNIFDAVSEASHLVFHPEFAAWVPTRQCHVESEWEMCGDAQRSAGVLAPNLDRKGWVPCSAFPSSPGPHSWCACTMDVCSRSMGLAQLRAPVSGLEAHIRVARRTQSDPVLTHHLVPPPAVWVTSLSRMASTIR